MTPARLFILTSLVMIAFASNSLLCRAALTQTNIDAASFTFVRIVSGAAALWIVLKMQRRLRVERTASPLVERSAGTWLSALALFVYAAGFSFAYNTLAAGTGAFSLIGTIAFFAWVLHLAALLWDKPRPAAAAPMTTPA